ncbi:MAG: TonB-dependent receptor [Chitinophagaceae bacterium]
MPKTLLYLFILFICLPLLIPGNLSAQEKGNGGIITGTVVSAADSKPMQGVTVQAKGTDRLVSTDKDGNFRIEAHTNAVLVFSFVGFTAQEHTVSGNQPVNIVLQLDVKMTDEVVVVGYGTRKKSHLTGAVAKITNDNLNQIPVARADQALVGKLAGVNIRTTDAQPGAAPTIQIRGTTSITAGSNPLIVIDGYPVPTDLSAVDMNDVESIEVLKDAASAAIYGSRGANGVVLITTRSGKSGKTKVSLNSSTGFKDVYRRYHFKSLDEWAEEVKKVNHGTLSNEIIAAQKFNVPTDPQDIVFRRGFFQNLQLNVSGGSNTVRYFVAGEAMVDKGVIITNKFNRYGVRANLDIRPNDKWQIGINVNPSYTVQQALPFKLHDLLRSFATWLPLYATDTIAAYTGIPVGYIVHQRDFDPSANKKYTGINLSATAGNNGYAYLNGITSKNYSFRNILNSFVKYNFTKDLSVRVSGGVFINNYREESFQQSWATVDPLIQGVAVARASTKAGLSNVQTVDWINENMLNYKKVIGSHDIDAIAVVSTQGTEVNSSSMSATNFATDNIPTLNAGTLSAGTSTKEKNTLASALVRVNYAYDSRYMLSVASRWDGSSRFGENKRWGYFPSVSVGWRISNENFWKENKTVSDLKLRASYGATGNNNIGNYRSYANVTPVGAILSDNISTGFTSGFFSNPDLGWERTFSFNAGVDAGFFNNKVRLSIDAYKSTTDKLLLYLPIPTVTGASGVWVNQGKVENKGLELELSVRVLQNKDLTWDVAANGSTNRNTLKAFGLNNTLISTGDPKRNNFFLAQVGQPLVQFYGYKYDSVVRVMTGNFWPVGVTADRVFAKDVNKDGTVNEADRTVLGQPYPKFNWGLTNNIRYKSFDLSFVLQGSHGAKVFNADPNYYEVHFSATGTSAYQAYSAADQARTKYKSESALEVEDASFIALRNLNVGYTLPRTMLSKWKISSLRFYVSTANLWYKFAKSYTSFNPEGVNEYTDDPLRYGYQRGAAPVTRTVAFGINAEF